MPPEGVILAFDTSAAHCAAVLVRDGRVLALRSEPMARGQAERLLPLVEELLTETNLTWPALAAIACGTGPGNFTGIRISCSLARGLSLALGIPAIGVSTFAALAPAPRIAVAVPGGFLLAGPKHETAVFQERLPENGDTILAAQDPGNLAKGIALAAARGGGKSPPVPFYARPADARPMTGP